MPDDFGEWDDEILHRIYEHAPEELCPCQECVMERSRIEVEIPQGYRFPSKRKTYRVKS